MTKSITLPNSIHTILKTLAAKNEMTILKYIGELIEKDEVICTYANRSKENKCRN